MYYILVNDLKARSSLLDHLRSREIQAVFHYVPLHSSPAGSRYGRTIGDLAVTEDVSERVVRLPLWIGLGDSEVSKVVSAVRDFF